jgi:hypothetical protein
MERPLIVDGGDGIQICRAAADILISRGRSTRGGPPAWRLGEGLTTPHCKQQAIQGFRIGGLL